jgi:hypothetical protein
MFKVILETQWKWARMPLLLATVAAFTIPMISVRGLGEGTASGMNALYAMVSMANWAVAYPLLAAAVGLLLALTAWGSDHRQGHYYALSLPIPRWRYSFLRLGAGFMLLAGPVIGIAIGSSLAAAAASIPAGLTAYPLALAIRFGLAATMAYTMLFAVSAGSARTAGFVLAVLLVILIAPVAVFLFAPPESGQFVHPILDRIYDWRGPLGIFGGRWLLIDV